MEINSSELELLIKKVIKSVINTFMEQLMDSNGSKNKQILVLVPDFTVNLLEFLKYIIDKHPGYELVIATSGIINELTIPHIAEIINVSEETKINKLLENANDYYKTYFVSPGIKVLEAIVTGDDRGLYEKLMINHVLHEKTCGIILDYNVKKLPCNNLTNKLSGLLNQVESMRISINVLNSKTYEEDFVIKEMDKLLITEKYVKELYSLGIETISNEQECIITPLAKDKMRELGIRFA